jgi:hypothetical protein
MAFSNGYNDMVLQQRFESDSKLDFGHSRGIASQVNQSVELG